ncbi:hypothetical protein ACEWY4_017306 [Coilia grayii]|uniref:Immunoglobulin domain-containing protein n=1 Tax=Coilia grayii TaxID=363190 RepID=A0ABD1JGT1_9TELE
MSSHTGNDAELSPGAVYEEVNESRPCPRLTKANAVYGGDQPGDHTYSTIPLHTPPAGDPSYSTIPLHTPPAGDPSYSTIQLPTILCHDPAYSTVQLPTILCHDSAYSTVQLSTNPLHDPSYSTVQLPTNPLHDPAYSTVQPPKVSCDVPAYCSIQLHATPAGDPSDLGLARKGQLCIVSCDDPSCSNIQEGVAALTNDPSDSEAGWPSVVSSLSVTGVEGNTVRINCFPSMAATDRGKYFCRGPSRYTCRDILRAEGAKVSSFDERFSLTPEPSRHMVVVQITELRRGDSGTYWCGLDPSRRFAEYAEIHLSVGFPLSIIVSVSLVAFVIAVTLLIVCRSSGKHSEVACFSNAPQKTGTIFPVGDYENTAFTGNSVNTQMTSFYQDLNPKTTQPDAVYQSLNPNTTQPDAVYQSLNPNTTQPDAVYQSLNPNTTQLDAVYHSLNPISTHTNSVYVNQ